MDLNEGWNDNCSKSEISNKAAYACLPCCGNILSNSSKSPAIVAKLAEVAQAPFIEAYAQNNLKAWLYLGKHFLLLKKVFVASGLTCFLCRLCLIVAHKSGATWVVACILLNSS